MDPIRGFCRNCYSFHLNHNYKLAVQKLNYCPRFTPARFALGTRSRICSSERGLHERTKKKPPHSGKRSRRDSVESGAAGGSDGSDQSSWSLDSFFREL